MADPFLTKNFSEIYVFHNFIKRFIIRNLITKKVVMKKLHVLKLMFLSFLIAGLFSCELKDDDIMRNLEYNQGLKGMVIVGTGDPGIEMPAELCGEPLFVPVKVVGMDPDFGNVMVANDDEYLYVKVQITKDCWEIKNLYMFAGAHDAIPLADETDPPSYPAFWAEEFVQLAFDVPLVSYTYRFLLADLPECPSIIIKALIVCDGNQEQVWAMGINDGWELNAFYFKYCIEDCNGCKPGIYRTQTPGGWGAKPEGNNPGAYLADNFSAAFPNGLEVGTGGLYTLTLTSAKAIETLLPTGGKPAALTENLVDPLKIKNVLVGHVVALSLSLGFDMYDPDFGEAEGFLGDLVIDSEGDFDGWTVLDVLQEANAVLGGAGSHIPVEMTEMLTMINEYFVDGKQMKNYKLFGCD